MKKVKTSNYLETDTLLKQIASAFQAAAQKKQVEPENKKKRESVSKPKPKA